MGKVYKNQKLDFPSREKVEAALRAQRGRVTYAAKQLGVSYLRMRRLIREHELEYVLEEERLKRVEVAEGVLDDLVEKGDFRAVAFTLRTLGKDKGYVERMEMTGGGGGPVQVEFVWQEGGISDGEFGDDTPGEGTDTEAPQ